MAEEKPPRAIQEEQFFLNAVLEQVQDAIVACTSKGVIAFFNRAAREIHGLPEKPIPAEEWANYYDLYLPDGETRMSMEDIPLFRALNGEYVNNIEMVIAPRGGTPRTLLSSACPLLGADGLKLGAIAVMQDITERKHTQETLKRESTLMQALMDNIPDAIYFKDTESRFTRVNQHAPYRGNKAPAGVIGKTDFDFFIEKHARAAYEDEQGIIRTGQPIIDKIEQETYPDGSVTWLSTTKVPILDETGKVTGLVGISRDITERKRAEEAHLQFVREQTAREQAEAANRLKDQFLAVVSHELRTPLTSILGWSHLLRSGQLDEENTTKAIETIERNARAQSQLIDDLLDVSRIITGNLRLEISPVDPSIFIETAIAALRPAAEAKGVSIQKIEKGAGFVAGDAARLQQVIWNLLSNAIKFTPEGGNVQIKVEPSNSQMKITVSDTGIGIKEEFLPYVFEDFRQGDQTTTRQHGGLGLGLAIVRHLVNLHGGTVQVESSGEGQGATFTLSLPMVSDSEVNELAERFRPQGKDYVNSFVRPERLNGLKVLVVDDDYDTRDFLRFGISQCGADVVTAGSAQEAIKIIEAESINFIVSDIGMPGEDGFHLIRKIRALPAERGGALPAIALTAYARKEDRLRALEAGYQMHVLKPVDLPYLVSVMASLVEKKV